MPIDEIISEIDAHLSCLRQVRDLLSAPVTEPRPKKAPRRKHVAKVEKTATAISSRPRVQENESRSQNQPRKEAKSAEPVDSVSHVRSTGVRPTKAPERPPAPKLAFAVERAGDASMISRDEPKPPIISTRGRAERQTPVVRVEKMKPANALASSSPSRIVVVSAEDAKRERDRAAHPEVRRKVVPASGLTGKLAFEALFKHETDPSKAS